MNPRSAVMALTLAAMLASCAPQRENVHFSSEAVDLSGTILWPRGSGPFPAVVFIHGSGPDSSDKYLGQATWFARHGFAALIYDK